MCMLYPSYKFFLFCHTRILWTFTINDISHIAFMTFNQKQNLLQPLLSPRSNAITFKSFARQIKKRIDKPILFFISPRRDSNAGKTRFRKPPLYPTELRGVFQLQHYHKIKNYQMYLLSKYMHWYAADIRKNRFLRKNL